jgi:hypothetical protein
MMDKTVTHGKHTRVSVIDCASIPVPRNVIVDLTIDKGKVASIINSAAIAGNISMLQREAFHSCSETAVHLQSSARILAVKDRQPALSCEIRIPATREGDIPVNQNHFIG